MPEREHATGHATAAPATSQPASVGKQTLTSQLVAPAAGPVAATATPAIPDDEILGHQARLATTDVEIPALEGALLASRLDAVKHGLLSRTTLDASLALSNAMTQLQPAAATGRVNGLLQQRAAVAAQQMFAALQREAGGDAHFKLQPSPDRTALSHNPYTQETRITTFALWWSTSNTASRLEDLPQRIRAGHWTEALRDYRALINGLDLWIADQLRQQGDPARGDAHQHASQILTGLEQIAGKHAKRVPALFHPDSATIAKERAAGRPAADAIPMNVYFWKDPRDGKGHLYDLTTLGRPHEQAIDGEPTVTALATFFEEVARYPEGEVRYTLPGGAAGIAATTGKTKWYEWVGYAGLAVAAVGLGLATAGASVPATLCFAAGAVAGGLSAGGHLLDTARLGTATTATVVLDVAQLAASFTGFGATAITIRAGGATTALTSSRWFVPLLGATAGADVVQLVALTDVTFVELTNLERGAGSPEDKQRAITILLGQLALAGGLAVLSVHGARNARTLAGQPLELIDQHGTKLLRTVGDSTSEPVHEPTRARSPEDGAAPTNASPTPSREHVVDHDQATPRLQT